MIFAVMILLLIWLFQYVFLDRYYESAKIRDISEVADKVADADGESRSDLIVKQSLENNLCIIVTDESGNSGMSANGLGDYSMLDKDVRENHSRWIFELKAKFAKQSNDYFTEDIEDEKTDYKGIIYCRKLSGGDAAYIFIESSAAPMDSTVKIIREQLIYITVILINLAFLVTLLISKWLSKPITSITNTAKQFAAGDYDTDFKGEGYKEVEELSSVLNNAKNEIKKVLPL
jgi:HAMP domain-containing protein